MKKDEVQEQIYAHAAKLLGVRSKDVRMVWTAYGKSLRATVREYPDMFPRFRVSGIGSAKLTQAGRKRMKEELKRLERKANKNDNSKRN